MEEKERILVFGAGALSLGFLGPMLFKNYHLLFCDLATKKKLIEHLQKKNTYLINVCSNKILPLRVKGVTGFNLSSSKERENVKEILRNVRIVFTSVGNRNLPEVLKFIVDNTGRNRQEKLFVFSAENDKSIIKKWTCRMGNEIELCNTIMGRMCRFDNADQDYQPIAIGFKEALVVEDFSGLPVPIDIYRQANLKGKTWEVMSKEEFEAKSYLKLFAHNGVHAYLSYLGNLQGLKHFYEASPTLISEAKALLGKEVIPAIFKEFGCFLDYKKVRQYCTELIERRITSRLFKDTTERGIRDSFKKLSAGERLVTGAKFILKNGFIPKYYSRIIAAGIMLNFRSNLMATKIDRILSNHCRIREKTLVLLIKKALKELKESTKGA